MLFEQRIQQAIGFTFLEFQQYSSGAEIESDREDNRDEEYALHVNVTIFNKVE